MSFIFSACSAFLLDEVVLPASKLESSLTILVRSVIASCMLFRAIFLFEHHVAVPSFRAYLFVYMERSRQSWRSVFFWSPWEAESGHKPLYT